MKLSNVHKVCNMLGPWWASVTHSSIHWTKTHWRKQIWFLSSRSLSYHCAVSTLNWSCRQAIMKGKFTVALYSFSKKLRTLLAQSQLRGSHVSRRTHFPWSLVHLWQRSQPQAVLSTRQYFRLSHVGLLLAPSGQRLRMMLIILWFAGQTPTTKNILAPSVKSSQAEKACVTGMKPLWLLVIGNVFRVLVWNSLIPA